MTKHKIKLSLLGFVILLAIVVAGLYFFGSQLIRNEVSKAATTSLGREVNIQDLSLDLWRGEINFDDITVQNVEDYDYPFAIKIKQGFIDIRLKSLLSQKIKIKSIELVGVDIFVEQSALNNNLRDLLDGMPALEEPEGPEQTEGKTVSVKTTTAKDLTAHLKIGKQGEELRTLKIKLDPITLENLGTEEEINSGAIAARIITALAIVVIKQSADELPKEVVNQITSLSRKIIDLGNVNLGKGREIIEETGEQLFDGVRELIPD